MKRRSSRRAGILTVALWAVALAVPLVAGCGARGEGGQQSAAPIPGVEAVQARRGALPLVQRLSGVVMAKNQIEIKPEVDGVVTEVLARNGEVVKKGQPLVRLRDKEFGDRVAQARAGLRIAQAQARQAEARLKEAGAEYDRMRELAAEQIVSTAELEAAEADAASAEADADLAGARVEQAAASLAQVEDELEQTVVRAPIAGSVGGRNAEVGQLVTGATQLFTLGQLDQLYVRVSLTDKMLGFIEEGQPVEVFSAGAGSGPIASTLTRISPFLHPVAHSTEAEIDLANRDGTLRPGMFVSVDIHYGRSREATLVPLSAVYEHPGTGATGVYVSREALDPASLVRGQDGMEMPFTPPVEFRFAPVDLIAQGRMSAGVEGVEDGDWVVTLGQNLLQGQAPQARVRPVSWDHVEGLQLLQREDLMREVVEAKASAGGRDANN